MELWALSSALLKTWNLGFDARCRITFPAYFSNPHRRTAEAHHVLGLQGCLWTEHVQDAWHAEMMLYPRVFAIAETGWSPAEKKDWPDFERRASVLSEVARKWGYNLFKKAEE